MDSEKVLANMGLVHEAARRVQGRLRTTGVADYDDLVSEGCIGLMKATETFEPEKGYQFSSYAYSVIRGYILNFVNNKIPAIRYPEKMLKMKRAIQYEQLTATQLIQRFKCSRHEAKIAFECANTKIISSHAEVHVNPYEHSVTIEDTIPSMEDFSTAEVEEFISTLSGREKAIVDMAIRGQSKLEIAQSFGVKPNIVKKEVESIGNRLRKYQAGLPYRGFRNSKMKTKLKITQ